MTREMPPPRPDPAPELAHFPPAAGAERGGAVVVFAGGGYHGRSEHEGAGYARFFAGRGFHAFVCAYRVAEDHGQGLHPAPLADALEAVRLVRSRAGELGFGEKRIGVVGSSAGGHLAAHLSAVSGTLAPVSRPDWTILCYPVIALFGPAAHTGSRDNLLGPDRGDEKAAALSPHQLVDDLTPPAFLWHTLEDGAVPMENSLLYAEALRRAGVPFELHVTERGRHGLGREADFDWADRAIRWLEESDRG